MINFKCRLNGRTINAQSVTTSGIVSSGSSLYALGFKSIGGNVDIGGTLTVASTIHSAGSGQIDGNLTVNGIIYASNSVKIGGTIVDGGRVQIGYGGMIYDTGGNTLGLRAGWSTGYTYFRFDTDGNGYASNGSWIGVSDISTKRDVVTLSQARSKIMAMRGVYYTEIGTGNRKVGVIGNEMLLVLPEATASFRDETGNMLVGVNYGGLIGPMIEGYKEHDAMITAIQARLDAHGIT